MPNVLPMRRSARLIIMDPNGRLLLFRYHDEHDDPFWSTPGGELKQGENYLQAAVRELQEETGFNATVGPFLRDRDDVYAVARAEPARWLERYFLVEHVSTEAPNQAGWTDEEQETIQSWRWWNLEEMRREAVALFRPSWLPELAEKTLYQREYPHIGRPSSDA